MVRTAHRRVHANAGDHRSAFSREMAGERNLVEHAGISRCVPVQTECNYGPAKRLPGMVGIANRGRAASPPVPISHMESSALQFQTAIPITKSATLRQKSLHTSNLFLVERAPLRPKPAPLA